MAVPFYWLVPGLATLYAVQSSLVALCALGVYRLARSEGAPPLGAAMGGVLVLLWWPLWRVAMADIRPLIWCMPFLLLCAAALRECKKWEAFTWGLLACMCREEIPLLVAFTAAAVWTWNDERRDERRAMAWRLALASLCFLVAATLMRSNTTFYIRPDQWLADLLQGTGVDEAVAHWGTTASEQLPYRLAYLSEWLLPAGIAALAAPRLLFGALPLAAYLFSQPHEWHSWEGPYVHHAAPAMALVAGAAAIGWTRISRHRRMPAFLAILLLPLLLGAELAILKDYRESVLAPELRPWLEQREQVVAAHELAAKVPPDAAVMADYHTVHLFSGRSWVYCYQQEELEEVEPRGPILEGPLLPPAETQPEWALIHVENPDWQARAAAYGLRRIQARGNWVLWGPSPRLGASP